MSRDRGSAGVWGAWGSRLEPQSKDLIYKIYQYFTKESVSFKDYQNGYFNNVTERTCSSMGISNIFMSTLISQRTQSKQKAESSRKYAQINNDSREVCQIRKIIYNIYLTNVNVSSIGVLEKKLGDEIGYEGSKDKLRRTLKEMGFTFLRYGDNKRFLAEEMEVRIKRMQYIRQMQKFRAERENVFFIGESFFKIPPENKEAESNRVIIVHAGNQHGFLSHALRLIPCPDSNTEYKKILDPDTFLNWVTHQLVPGLPPNSVLVMADYRLNRELALPPPEPSATRSEFKSWLDNSNIPYNPELTKIELWSLIQEHKDDTVMIDRMLHKYGHTFIRLPMYHSDLNPLDTVFSNLKSFMAENGTGLKLPKIEMLIAEKVSSMDEGSNPQEWIEAYEEVLKLEKEYIELDKALDIYTEHFNFTEDVRNVDSDEV